MILIVTLNPLLERRYTCKSVDYGNVNRDALINLKPGGKGINVSRQLKQFGLSSYNLFFSGGNEGKLYREVIRKEGFEFSSVQIESETRSASVIIDEDLMQVTSFFSEDPAVTEKECDEFINRLDKMIRNCEMIIFSGSSVKGAEKIIPACIEIANKYDKVSICDTYGSNLENCLNQAPTIIHNNADEIKNSLNIPLASEEEFKEFLDLVNQKNIKRSFVTDGANTFYSSNFGYHYRITPPFVNAVDSTGSGDSFVAGIIYCWHNNLVFEDSLRFATALAAVNSTTFQVCNVKPEEVERLSPSVIVESIGKKIKTIDDTPR